MCSESLEGSRSIQRSQVARLRWNQPLLRQSQCHSSHRQQP
uniref:Uncharacterized protein n=1 Tax=Arundo donax TaxID=35708 RepID=A0A0A9F5X6_ARUDO